MTFVAKREGAKNWQKSQRNDLGIPLRLALCGRCLSHFIQHHTGDRLGPRRELPALEQAFARWRGACPTPASRISALRETGARSRGSAKNLAGGVR